MSPEYDFHLKIEADNPEEAGVLRDLLIRVKGISLIEPITPSAQDSIEKVEFTLPATGQTLQPEMLFNSAYTFEILKACLALPIIVEYYGESLISQATNMLTRGYRHRDYNSPGLTVSMQELLSVNDDELLSLRHFGPKSLALFRDATRPLVNQYREVLGRND